MSRAPALLALAISCQPAQPAQPAHPPTPEVPVYQPPDRPDPPGEEWRVFDDSFVHQIEIEVDEASVNELSINNDVRIPCTFTFDGLTLEEVGIRLKGNHGSARDISTGKVAFSVKLNEFIPGQKLFGLKKLIINNEVQDSSFVARRLGYEIWRRAGVPAPRVAYARLTFNGEYFGLYTIEEAYGKDLLARWFDDPGGNLYEGNGADISNVGAMELDTNELANDRSDLTALAEALETPDEAFLEAISAHVDLEQFTRYWAVERLLDHYDGYGTVRSDQCCSPNNYYAYYDPGRQGFVFLPRGADTVFRFPDSDISDPPREKASLAWRLFHIPEGRARLASTMEELLEQVWKVEELEAVLDDLSAQVLEGFTDGGREETNTEGVLRGHDRVRTWLQNRPAMAQERLGDDF
jgi:spore coat protein H